MSEVWLVTIPNRGKPALETIQNLTSQVAHRGLSEVYVLDMPLFNVGTLDSLMTLSDEMPKLNVTVENVIRKIERQYADLGGRTQDPLRIYDMTPERYLHTFQWDFARLPRRPLAELIQTIKANVTRVDEELRNLSTAYLDRVQFLSALKRKKSANYATSDLEDFLTPELVSQQEWLNTENLLTVLVVIPKQTESEFLESYDKLGREIAAFGGPDWQQANNFSRIGQEDERYGPEFRRDKITGSPVVPGSARAILRTGDQYVYSLTILKGHYTSGYYDNDQFVNGTYISYLDRFKDVCKEKRYTVREFAFDPEKAGALDSQIETSSWELQNLVATLLRWCRAHYGETFSAWIHLKTIHAFIESVLRYGLPLDFAAAFIEPNERKKDQAERALKRCVAALGDIFQGPTMIEEEDEDEEEIEGGSSTDHLPFVLHKFIPNRS